MEAHSLSPQRPPDAARVIRLQLQDVAAEEIRRRVESFMAATAVSRTDREILADIYKIVLPGSARRMAFSKSSFPVPVGAHFFRGRAIANPAEDLKTTFDVWQPKAALVRNSGRLNGAGESILYTSIASPTTAVHECRLVAGDLFAMSRFEAKTDFQSSVVGEDPCTPVLDADEYLKLRIIQSFLDRAFSAKAHAGNPDPYRISRLIALEFFDLPPQIFSGWAFRSVMDPSGGGWNFAFRPELGRKALRYKETHVYRLHQFDAGGVRPLTELVAAYKPCPGTDSFHCQPSNWIKSKRSGPRGDSQRFRHR